MRLHILSDLHLEFATFEPEAVDADVIVLAGDIHAGREGCEWIRGVFPNQPVAYVLGNHEFYNEAILDLTQSLKRESDGSHIHLLENSVFEFDGYSILGCSLWTDFQLLGKSAVAQSVAEGGMADYGVIFWTPEGRRLRSRDTAAMHQESMRWLKEELSKHDPKKCVVVTHHAPSGKSIPSYHAGNGLSAAFASNLDEMIESSGIRLRVHGHTHHNVDYMIGTTRVLSNQRGYPDQLCGGFDAGLVVEV